MFVDSLYCINATPVQLPTINSTYTGAGISGAVFTPATAGAGYHLLTRTVATHGCSVQLTENVRVNAVIPDPTITAPATVCEGSGYHVLHAATTGGAWSGSYVSIDSATGLARLDSRASGAGLDTITYTVTKSACTATNKVIINVLSNYYNLPYTFPHYCTTSPPVVFDTTGNRSYFGLGFSNNTFHPDSIGARGPVFYAVATVNNLGCRDTFIRMLNLLGGQLDVYNQQYVCKPNDSLFINLGYQYDSIRWNDGSVSNMKWFADTGSYPVFLRDTGGCYGRDTLHIGLYNTPAQIVTSTSVYACPSDSAVVKADSLFTHYLWSNGSTTQSIMALPGTYTVTITAYSGCKYASPPVTVTTGPDVTPPTITCASDTLLYAPAGSCSVTGISLNLPQALDNCGLASVTSNAPSSYTVGVTHVYLDRHDFANNTKTCLQKVTVNDTIKPYFTTEPAIGLVVDTEQNNCSTRVPNLLSLFTASDSCSGASLSQSPSAGALVTSGTTAIAITARDSSGNTIVYYITFKTLDTVAPVINCPSDITTTISGATTTAVIHYAAPTHASNCSNSTVQRIAGLGSGAAFPIGVTTERYVVTDGTGVTDTCSFAVTVNHVIGIIETNTNDNSLAVMPVPATDHLTVIYKNNSTTSLHLKLMNALGQVIHEETVAQFNGDYNQNINLSEQPAGTYILEIVSDNETITREIVKISN